MRRAAAKKMKRGNGIEFIGLASSNLLVSKDLIKGNVNKPINNNNLNHEFETIEFILGITLPISDKIKK